MYQLGVDEAGRGPAIGPLVVCALGMPSTDVEILMRIGAKDSKSLSKKKRVFLAEQIFLQAKKRKWDVGLITCSASRIDIEREITNLNKLEVELFKEAIVATKAEKYNGEIYLDACDTDEKRFRDRVSSSLGSSWSQWSIKSQHKMDLENILVGAASILAKVHRDKEIEKIGQLLGLEIGSGYPSDQKTRVAIKNLVKGEYPNKYLRWSWVTTENIWLKENRKPIPKRGQVEENSKQSSISDW